MVTGARHIVVLGPPGAGKGSLASLCDRRLGLAHVSAGDIFRQEIARRSVVGRRVQRYVSTGRLVPDALVVNVMTSRLAARRFTGGFVVDGFPRTRGQAVGLDRALRGRRTPLDAAIYLTAPGSVLVRRLAGRRVCAQCGATFHVRTMRPQRPGRCDRCHGRLVVRKDDRPETIQARLAVDRKASKPLLQYYRRRGLLHQVDGSGHVERVFRRMCRLLERLGAGRG